jgi:glycosyltransferase involved in cell wall biosynthesis
MFPIRLQPDQVEFVLLSFEGPDAYSKAGGLGVRVANLAEYLAGNGFQTHLIFIGSPDLPSREERLDGRLHYHRWCQWISRYHPLGVYDGDEGKLVDFNGSVPAYIVENIARPAIAQRRHLVVLAEEWHTAEALIRLSDALYAAGLRSNSILLWNANNTMGFERIDWPRLSYVSTLTTVSRYMKQIMRTYGLDPLIIPNGIPTELLKPTPKEAVRLVRERLVGRDELMLFKVGRYDPAKCWLSAVEAAAQLKQGGEKVRFLCRGGIEAHGEEVLDHARTLGLVVKDVIGSPETWQEAVEAISGSGAADVFNLRFSMSPEMLRVFYAAADFVIANSKHEPFGLVGLEAMAAGGVVFTGPTGETYSVDGAGAIALDTEQAGELVLAIENLRENPEKALAIRQSAPLVASRYTWENVVAILFEKICLAGDYQKVRPFRMSLFVTQKPVQKVAVKTAPDQPKLPAWPIPVKVPVEITLNAMPG